MDDRHVFIDADSLLYRATYGKVSDKTMRDRYRERLDYIRVQTFSDKDFVAIKGIGNFRFDIDPDYKGNRPSPEPEQKRRLNMLAEYALELGAISCHGWEADDQVIAWAYEAQQENIPWIIAGIDKDLLQFPGTHFNYGGTKDKPLTEEKKWKFIDQKEGDYRFAAQLLTGDTTDNIFGIKGIGPVKAEKELLGLSKKQMMERIIELYKTGYGTQWSNKLYKNCNLIYMRRWLDDTFDYSTWLKDEPV